MSHARTLRLFLTGYGLLDCGRNYPAFAARHYGRWCPSILLPALFTAVSAVCLVGLTVVNTATHFTLFGQVVLLLLIQFGALHYLFFALYLIRQCGHPTATPEEDKTSTGRLLRQIVVTTLLIEVGAFLLILYTAGNYEAGRNRA